MLTGKTGPEKQIEARLEPEESTNDDRLPQPAEPSPCRHLCALTLWRYKDTNIPSIVLIIRFLISTLRMGTSGAIVTLVLLLQS